MNEYKLFFAINIFEIRSEAFEKTIGGTETESIKLSADLHRYKIGISLTSERLVAII